MGVVLFPVRVMSMVASGLKISIVSFIVLLKLSTLQLINLVPGVVDLRVSVMVAVPLLSVAFHFPVLVL